MNRHISVLCSYDKSNTAPSKTRCHPIHEDVRDVHLEGSVKIQASIIRDTARFSAKRIKALRHATRQFNRLAKTGMNDRAD